MFTDRSRPDDGATRYSMIWQNGQSWAGIETHMAYGAESAALARALGTASLTQPPPPPPKRVTIFHGRPGHHQAHGLGGA